jgi:hypothetical protein
MRLAISVILLGFLTGSCNEKLYTGDVNCDECYTDKPESADLVIDVTLNNQYYQVPIVVYKGDVEENVVVAVDTADYTPFYVLVPVDEKYAVKAEYKKGESVLYVIDGTKIKLRSVTDACDEPCYIIEGETMDARIKKEFIDY